MEPDSVCNHTSDYKITKEIDELVQNTEVYGPIKFEEIVIFMINYLINQLII